MVENDYPVPSYLADVFQKPEGWIETPQLAPDAEASNNVYAIDCEMVRIRAPYTTLTIMSFRFQCMTQDGKALTHICVIDFQTGKVLYDQLVKPPSPITDYLTR